MSRARGTAPTPAAHRAADEGAGTTPARDATTPRETAVAGVHAEIRAVLTELTGGEPVALRSEEAHALVLRLFDRLGLGAVAADDFTTRTLRYYRSRGVVAAPTGHAASARWTLLHVLQGAVARLAGRTAGLSLDRAAEVVGREGSADRLIGHLAELVAAHRAALHAARLAPAVAALAAAPAGDVPRPLPSARATAPRRGANVEPGTVAETAIASPRVMLTLPHGVVLLVPPDHDAWHDAGAAESLATAVRDAVRAAAADLTEPELARRGR